VNTSRRVLVIVQARYLHDPRPRREAEALVEAGYHVDVIARRSREEPVTRVVNGVRVYGLPLERKFGSKARYVFEYGVFLLYATLLAAVLHLRRRYAVVHVHTLPDTLVLAALLPKMLGARIVFDAHESMPESLRMKYGCGPHHPGVRLLAGVQRASMALADHVLTVHEPMRQLFIQRGVPPHKMSIVMNWPDERLFTSAEPLPHRGFTLIYAGMIAERHGLQTVLRALPLLAPHIPGLRVRIMGRGDYTAALQHLARELGVEPLVSFEDPVPLAEVATHYRAADLGLSPLEDAVFGDITFSTKVAEYLAVGLPAVVARTSVMAHYLDESQVAFFTPGDPVELAARVRALYHDPSYRRRLIANGLALSRRCSWSNERTQLLSVMSALA
jgi:glycosyltransferase involved in cell wall biosynthesis